MIILKIKEWRNVVLFNHIAVNVIPINFGVFLSFLRKIQSFYFQLKKLATKMSRVVFPTPFGQMVKEYSGFPRKRRKIWNGLGISIVFFFLEGVIDKVFFLFLWRNSRRFSWR